jgi:hypothetical protein
LLLSMLLLACFSSDVRPNVTGVYAHALVHADIYTGVSAVFWPYYCWCPCKMSKQSSDPLRKTFSTPKSLPVFGIRPFTFAGKDWSLEQD